MYFALVSVLPKLRFLEDGLAALLIFVGAKMVLPERMQIPTEISLGIIAVIMAIAVGASLLCPKGALGDGNNPLNHEMLHVNGKSTATCHPRGVALHEPTCEAWPRGAASRQAQVAG